MPSTPDSGETCACVSRQAIEDLVALLRGHAELVHGGEMRDGLNYAAHQLDLILEGEQ